MLNEYIKFRHEVVIRRTKFQLKKAEDRAHIIEGLKIAIDNIDEVVSIIRSSKNPDEAKQRLIARFEITEIQAQAILDMRLQRLTGLEKEKLEAEYLELIKKISEYKNVMENRDLRMEILKQEFLEIKEKFADPRRTRIIEDIEEVKIEDLIAEEDMVVTISHSGYIKRLPVNIYRQQGRGGKGLSGISLKEGDFVTNLFVASTHSYILFFTDQGNCYWLRVFEIPRAGRTSRGKPIVNLLQLEKNEKIVTFTIVKGFLEDPSQNENKYVIMSTKKGMIKKTELTAFSHPRASGIIAIKIAEDDELLDAQLTDSNDEIILGTSFGYANRFYAQQVRAQGRNTYGVRGITLRENDVVIGMVVAKRNGTLLVVTENGYGKRTPISDYRLTNRGSKGIITIKTTERNGYLVSIQEVLDDEDLLIITSSGKVIRQYVKNIPVISRNTQGVRLIKLSEGDKVSSVAKIGHENNQLEEEINEEEINEEDKN
jgi:DNA gyrase subunit A